MRVFRTTCLFVLSSGLQPQHISPPLASDNELLNVPTDNRFLTDAARELPQATSPEEIAAEVHSTGDVSDGVHVERRVSAKGISAGPGESGVEFPSSSSGVSSELSSPVNDERVQVNERRSSEGNRNTSGAGRGVVAVTYKKAINEFLVQTRGIDWLSLPAEQRPLVSCSENLHLKGRGCGLLVPTCTNVAKSEWSCTMVIWQSCSCSESSSRWLRWLPSPQVCYGDKTYLLDLDWDGESAEDAAELVRDVPGLIIPTGHCGWSSFFMLVVTLLSGAGLSLFWAAYRRICKKSFLVVPGAAERTESRVIVAATPTNEGVTRRRRKTLIAVDG